MCGHHRDAWFPQVSLLGAPSDKLNPAKQVSSEQKASLDQVINLLTSTLRERQVPPHLENQGDIFISTFHMAGFDTRYFL